MVMLSRGHHFPFCIVIIAIVRWDFAFRPNITQRQELICGMDGVFLFHRCYIGIRAVVKTLNNPELSLARLGPICSTAPSM